MGKIQRNLLRSAETTSDCCCCCRAVCDAQNKVTNSLLEQCSTREPFRQLLTEMYDYPRFRVPSKKGSRYYYRQAAPQAEAPLPARLSDGLQRCAFDSTGRLPNQ